MDRQSGAVSRGEGSGWTRCRGASRHVQVEFSRTVLRGGQLGRGWLFLDADLGRRGISASVHVSVEAGDGGSGYTYSVGDRFPSEEALEREGGEDRWASGLAPLLGVADAEALEGAMAA